MECGARDGDITRNKAKVRSPNVAGAASRQQVRETKPSGAVGLRNGKRPGQALRGYPCETKPTEAVGAVCGVPAGASDVAQPPSAGNTAEGGGAPCVTTNGTDSAKQSQPAGPEALAIADFGLQIEDCG